MIRFLCLIATEDRLWNMRRAFRSLAEKYPGMIEGQCWSVWELSTDPQKIPQMLQDAQNCDFAMVYFHGGAGTIENFHTIWQALIERMPVYFESSMPDEIAELLPVSGLTPEEYRTIRSYFSIGSRENYEWMLLHIAKTRFEMDCEVLPPQPLAEDGFYTVNGILTQDEAEQLKIKAAKGEKTVVGLILHQTHIMNGNTRHIDAICGSLNKWT